jgi:hypothetical protein
VSPKIDKTCASHLNLAKLSSESPSHFTEYCMRNLVMGVFTQSE